MATEPSESDIDAFAAMVASTPESATSPQSRSPSVTAFDRWLVRRVLQFAGQPAIAVHLWNGERIAPESSAIIAEVTFADRITLLKTLLQPSLGFGEAYMDGRVTVRGSLVELCTEICRGFPSTRLKSRGDVNTINRSRRNAQHHYDLGNDFYRLWLDSRMVYTCAYYREPQMSLDAAQEAKLELVCHKLRLQPGQEVVEAGCGWGALAIHMAERFGVKVTACNVSHQQIIYAREQARERGLEQRVNFVEDDWRNLSGRYDAFVSVGMLEHVGIRNYRLLGDTIYRLLKPEGLGLIHSIGRSIACPLDPWTDRYIFPGACPPDLNQMMTIFTGHQFSILDIENLRLHYQRTLEDWLSAFEARASDVRSMFDERFVRMWRLYLSASVAAFKTGQLQLFQVLFAHPQNNHVPLTRADLADAV